MRTFDMCHLTFIINHVDHRCNDDAHSITLRKSTIDDLCEFAASFDAQQPPTEGFHRDLWLLVRAEVNRLLRTYAK